MIAMRPLIQVFLFAAAICLVENLAAAEMRTWTDISGEFEIRAEYLGFSNGIAYLKSADGQRVEAKLDRLSQVDQEYVRRQIAGEPEPSEATEQGAVSSGEAVIELITGAKSSGRLVSRNATHVTIEASVGSRTVTRQYPLDRIHAITIGGRREVLNESGSAGSSGDGGSSIAGDYKPGMSAEAPRSAAEVKRLIDQIGPTPPDWWDSVQLNYPRTLDLSWPQKAPGDWNAQRNMGQYIWEIINPNQNKWREGIRLMHHLLELHKDNRVTRDKVMQSLGSMYHDLMRDYARAAFWWQKAGIGTGSQSPVGVKLAECYWKLGNKQMALDLLRQIPIYYSSIKVLADMGETEYAIKIAESAARSLPDLAYLYAGDACRIEGRYQDAIRYFQKVLAVRPAGRTAERTKRNHQRARANIEGITIFDTLDLAKVADGSYRSDSPGYAGQLHVEVTVRGGRIQAVRVTQHKEKQFYSAINDTPEQIIAKQGVKGVDAVTGATITSEAIINATAKALAQGLK